MYSRINVLWQVVILLLVLTVLYLGGAIIDRLELDVWDELTFFNLRFYCFAGTPFWLLAGLMVLIANGMFLLRWSVIRGNIKTPSKKWFSQDTGDYQLYVPLPTLKMLALNLLLLPAVWITYLLIVSHHWNH